MPIKDTDRDNKRKVIDLHKATEPNDGIYICEYCDCRLIPYIDIKGERLTRGKLFQCGKCGLIKDTAGDNLKHPEKLITKGDNIDLFLSHLRMDKQNKPKPIDFDPGDDAMYKGMGFHIVRTRITAGGKVLRDDTNLS